MLFQTPKYSGTILVYTLVLVVLAVFMATAVLNTTTQLYNSAEISDILSDTQRGLSSKAEYVLRYDENLNNTGSGFIDDIGCPLDFSMSGATLQNSSMSSTIRYLSGSILCRANYYGNDVDFYFNSSFTDLETVEYLGDTRNINASVTSVTFSDGDSTFLDVAASFPLPSDGYDDNFDDDDFSPYMNGGGDPYPDGYTDNDGDARRIAFGYITPLPESSIQNIYWLNEDIRDVIYDTNFNVGANFIPIGNIIDGRIYISSDQNYSLSIYELDKDSYILEEEIALEDVFISGNILSGSGYIQSDMTVNPTITGNEFIFDFSGKDYAIFLENKSQNVLSYSFRVEDDNSGNEAYITPINYGGGGSYYASNNVIIDDRGFLIGGDKLVSLGSFSISDGTSSNISPSISGLMGWYDMTNSLYYTESGGRVSQVNDRSGNGRHLTQSNSTLRPVLGLEGMTGSGYAGSYFDITNPTSIARVYAKVSYDYTTFQDSDYFLGGTSGSFGSPRIMGNSGNTNLSRSQNPTDVTVSVDGGVFSDTLPLPLDSSVLIFDFDTPGDFTSVMGSSVYSARSFKGEFEKLLLYNTVPSAEEEAQIIEYLNYEGPGFLPTEVEGIVAWYDASDTDSIISSGGLVSQWNDKSNNGLHATQTIESQRPITGSSSLNGLNTLDFNVDSLALPDLSSYINGDQNRTIIMVHRNDSSGSDSFNIGVDSSLARYTLRRVGNNARFELNGAGNTTDLDVTSESILIVRQDGTTRGDISMYQNGGSPYDFVGLNTIGTDASSGNFIGERAGSNSRLQGTIQEIILYDTNISDSDMNLIGNYLSDKWGLSWTDL